MVGQSAARHPWWFIGTWIVFVVGALAAAVGGVGGQSLFERLHTGAPRVPSDSATGADLLARTSAQGETVFLLLDDVDPASPTARQAVTAAAGELSRMSPVLAVQTPYGAVAGTGASASAGQKAATGQAAGQGAGEQAAKAMIATDGRAVLVSVVLVPGLPPDSADAALDAVLQRLRQVPAAVPGSSALVGGMSTLVDDITDQVETDLATGETIALPASLLVMILVFAGFLAAGLPIVGAVASIAGALASLLAFSYAMELDAAVVNVVTVLALGLCIDYGLLLVSRYREELRRLHAADELATPQDSAVHTRREARTAPWTPPSAAALEGALVHTMTTAGRTVAFSGVTVAVSCCGLLLFSADILRAVGAAAVSVVVIALLVALTLVPALLALAGDRLIRPGVLRRLLPFGSDVAPAEGAFSRLGRGVQRHPVLVLLGVLVVLMLAAVPALEMHLVDSGTALLPKDAPQRQLFDRIDARFPAVGTPQVQVVTRAPATEVAAWATSEVARLPGVVALDPVTVQARPATPATPATPGTPADEQVTTFGVRTHGDAQSDAAREVVQRIRGLDPGFQVYVTGQAAYVLDFVDDVKRRAPLAVGLVVMATFVLLFLMTGSVFVPVKALLMNIVSLGAAFGALVWLFQEGHLEQQLGFTSAGGIETMIPAFALAFGFGLAMDYEVFLLARIKEHHDRGLSNDEAVVRGLQGSGRIITSAALIVVLVFAGFVAGKLLIIKQTGVALAIAVAVDATLVRMLLVPATMTLLGEWNWWAPKRLRNLYERFGLRE